MGKVGWAAAFVVFWSSGFVAAVLAEPAGSVAGVLAWRYLLTAALLSATIMVWARARISGRDIVQQGVMGLLAHVVFLGGVFGATAGGVSAGTVALVCALQPMLVTVAGRLGWGDAVSVRQVAGLIMGLVAVAVTVGGATTVSAPLLVLPVVSLMGLSGAALLERRWRPDVDVVSSLCVQVTVSAGVFAAYAALSGQLSIPMSRDVVGALAWQILISGIGGYAAFVMCLRTLGSTTTSLLLYVTPPLTTIWAWAMLAQAPTVGQWFGLSMGAIAVALAWPRAEPAPNDSTPGAAAEPHDRPSVDRVVVTQAAAPGGRSVPGALCTGDGG